MGFLEAYRKNYITFQKERIRLYNRIEGLKNEYGAGKEIDRLKTEVLKPVEELEKTTKEWMVEEVQNKPIWQYYLKHIKGIGKPTAGKLIGGSLSPAPTRKICEECGASNYKSNVNCQECEADIQEDGFTLKDCPEEAPHPSSFQKYCGVIPDENGEPMKLSSGEKAGYNTDYKSLLLKIILDGFMRAKGEYYGWYNKYRNESEVTNPDWPKGRHHWKAKRKVAQLFLSHLWTVWRTLEGLPINFPYSVAKEKGHSFVPPFVEIDGEAIEWAKWYSREEEPVTSL